jgi:hypothetical protein
MERVKGKSSAHVRIMRVRSAQEAGHTSHDVEEGLAECVRNAA